MGEVRSDVYIDLQTIARNTIKKIGYTKAEYQFDGDSCGILTAIHEQSDDINRGVDNGNEDEQGAGDQGMMFGYATNETESLMPVSLDLAHLIMRTLAEIRKEGKVMTYLRPDSKSQVTVQYSDAGIPERIDTIVLVLSTLATMKVVNLPTSSLKPVEVLVVPHSINTPAIPNIQKVFTWAIVGLKPLMLKASGIVNHTMVMITLFNIHSVMVCPTLTSVGDLSTLIN